MNIIINRILPVLSVIISIGLSDMIEFFLSPRIHEIHNCPDIMQLSWSEYNAFYAFMSGIKCSWFLILPTCFFKHSFIIIYKLNIINLLIPVCCYITRLDKKYILLSHNLLYIVNFVFIIFSIFFGYQ